MAAAIKNPNKFSPQFLADMKKGNPELYKSYTSGGKLSVNVALNITPSGTAMWTVTQPGSNATANNRPNNGGTSWASFPSSQNKGAGTSLSNNGPGVATVQPVYDQFGETVTIPRSGNSWALPGGDGFSVQDSGTGIITSSDGSPSPLQIRFAPTNAKGVGTGYMPYVADPSITSLKQLQTVQNAIGQPIGDSGKLFSNNDLDNILNYGSNSDNGSGGKTPAYSVDASTGTVSLSGNGQPSATIKTTYDPKHFDNNGNLKGWATLPGATKPPSTTTPKPKPVTSTTVPKPPTKPPVTPTTVPKPPVTPTTVPKPPVTPTTVPKPPVAPTTVPKPPAKPPVVPTTVPKPPTTTPKPPTTIPPTTFPPNTHPSSTPPTAGTTTTTTPGILPGANFGSTSGVNWPSAAYMRKQGLSEALITAYAGKPVDNVAYPKDQAGAIRSMVDDLTEAQARQLFAPWIAQGFDPFASRDSSKLAVFNKQVKSFMPSVVSKGWDNVDPTEWTLTNGKATHTPKTTKIVDPNTGKETTVQVDSTKQVTAYGTIQNELAAWGLSDLSDEVFNKVFKDGISDPKQLTNYVRSTKEYKNNFQGMAEYNANPAHTQKITEQQYLLKAQAYMNTAQQYGLPDSFFTKKEIGQLVAGGVSPAEFNRRVVNGYLTAMNADPATRQALAAQGVDFGHLLAYYLDPKRAEPMLTDRTNQAQLQGYAQNAGIANLTPTMAQELTQRAKSNLNPDGTFSTAQEQQALDVAAQGQGLTATAPGGNAQTVDTTQLIGTKLAGFGGTTQAEAQQATQKALQGQEAPFQKAGGYATNPQGVTGIGSSPQ